MNNLLKNPHPKFCNPFLIAQIKCAHWICIQKFLGVIFQIFCQANRWERNKYEELWLIRVHVCWNTWVVPVFILTSVIIFFFYLPSFLQLNPILRNDKSVTTNGTIFFFADRFLGVPSSAVYHPNWCTDPRLKMTPDRRTFASRVYTGSKIVFVFKLKLCECP